MNLKDFLRTQPNKTYTETDSSKEFTLSLINNCMVMVDCDGKTYSSDNCYDIQNWLEENYGIEFRICNHCGKPMFDGMTDLEDFYTHEGKCFENEMDRVYGKNKWKPNDSGEVGECGGYYDCLDEDNKWNDTGIFYTEWY